MYCMLRSLKGGPSARESAVRHRKWGIDRQLSPIGRRAATVKCRLKQQRLRPVCHAGAITMRGAALFARHAPSDISQAREYGRYLRGIKGTHPVGSMGSRLCPVGGWAWRRGGGPARTALLWCQTGLSLPLWRLHVGLAAVELDGLPQ